MNPLRRRPWGTLWAKAGWDGTKPEMETLRIPNTTAAPLPQSSIARPRSLRMGAFGRLLVGVPWSGAVLPVSVASTVNFDLTAQAHEDSANLSAADTLQETTR